MENKLKNIFLIYIYIYIIMYRVSNFSCSLSGRQAQHLKFEISKFEKLTDERLMWAVGLHEHEAPRRS